MSKTVPAAEALDEAADRRSVERSLAASLGSDRDARWIVEDAFGGAGQLGEREAAALARRLARRRAAGEPLQYVLGHWPFRDLDLLVDGRALIPRPETEWLTDIALAELDRLLALGAIPKLVDLGTGTGAIALSIAVERAGRGLEVVATDVDPATLALAEANRDRVAERHDAAAAVRLAAGSWWAALGDHERGSFSLAVSNPPYVSRDEWAGVDAVVREHEPPGALVADAGRDGTPGLGAIEAILAGASDWLARPAAAVIELAPAQGGAALRVARDAGARRAIVLDDLAGRQRALVARFE